MKEKIQIIERNGKPEWAVLPYEEYLQLLDQSELLEDIRDFDAINVAIERHEEELIPAEVVYAILDGANPIKVWREYRELTQQQLADTTGISKPYLSQIETGKRAGTTEILSAIAKALDVSLEELVTTPHAQGRGLLRSFTDAV
jgi:DNA-binding XRE family transcriptional regulator